MPEQTKLKNGPITQEDIETIRKAVFDQMSLGVQLPGTEAGETTYDRWTNNTIRLVREAGYDLEDAKVKAGIEAIIKQVENYSASADWGDPAERNEP